MRPSAASLFPLVIVALLAAATFWLQRTLQFGDVTRSGKDRHDPDFVVENFSVRHFGPSGALQHSGSATKMTHYPDTDTTEMILPTFNFEGSRPLHVTAARGWMDKDGKVVRLEDDVRVVRPADQASAETVVSTGVMFVYPDDEIARTDAPVTLSQGRSVVTGSGFEADNKQQTLVVKGRVHGTIYRLENLPPH